MLNYPVDVQHLNAMLDGQRRDLLTETFQTFDQLYGYCYNVASVVGLTCISVWGYTGGKATRELAEKRGIAFQLTNILRDVHEDFQRGRVYLPADELAQFNVDPRVFVEGNPDTNFDRLMKFQLERAMSYYDDSAELESHLSADCQSTCWAMMRIYRGLLEKIAENPRRVLTERVRLTKFQKTAIALRAKFRKPQV
jgi:phytoene synthase